MVTKVRTLDFLPDIFRTDYNSQFLRAVLDPLVQDKNLEPVEGFIGSKFGPGVNALNAYVPELTAVRTNYQLEPGVVFLKTDQSKPRDYISYPEIIDSLKLDGGVTDNHSRMFQEQYYTWDSFVNLDPLINYGQYYWLKDGPHSVTVKSITTTILDVETEILGKTTYTSPNGVVFTNGLKVYFDTTTQPAQYAGQEFYVEGVGSSITLLSVSGQIAPERFTQLEYLPWSSIMWDEGVWDARLYVPVQKDYITIQRNSIDRNAWSRSNQWFHIDVIRATAEYNNDPDYLSVANRDNRAVRPIVEFYGNLRLFNSGTNFVRPVDYLDTRCTDAFSLVSGTKYYYPDVKAYSTATATVVSWTPGLPQSIATISVPTANVTGIISVNDFIGADGNTPLPTNAQVTNVTVNGPDTIIDIKWASTDTITLPFNNIPLVFTPLTIGAYALFDGSRIIFTADTNPTVRNKVYVARFDSVVGRYTLTLADDGDVQSGAQTIITRGVNHSGYDYWYDGITWKTAQQKTCINQEPLFDVYNNSGVSFSDTSAYPSSSFAGCTLFEYAKGTGKADLVLGFPLKYSGNINNLGEITFDVTLNSDTFNYIVNNVTKNVRVNTGYVHAYTDYNTYTRRIGWVPAIGESVQYQMFQIPYTYGRSSNQVTIDIPADYESVWPKVQLYLNNVQQSAVQFSWTVNSNGTTTVIFTPPSADSMVQVLILSNSVSPTGYYVVPINLAKNPFNEDITTVTTSELRYYFQSIFYNSNIVTGSPIGENNYRDVGNLTQYGIGPIYGTSIIKHSASVATPGSLLRDGNYDLVSALQFNAQEYVTYKNLLMYTVDTLQFDTIYTSQYMLDAAIKVIADAKNNSGSFFWSDMLPSGTTYSSKNYNFNNTATIATFPLSRVYDYSKANYWGLLVYVTRNVNGVSTQTLLVKDRDYKLSDITPSVVVSYDLQTGDVVTVREYNITYGTYVPYTPTKLGMYPATIPHVYTDTHLLTPTTFIVGHDGSHTKIYGQLDAAGNLVDFRDRVLLEFETRIYNNIKLDGFNVLDPYDYLPGKFRTMPYSYNEFMEIYSPQFLTWIGANRVNYKSQYYRSDDQFTWNYRTSYDKLSNQEIEIGYWRELYEYWYDTSTPDTTPWEMLHYVEKPDWWDNYYGAAPYTSENTLLWTDLSNGYDWNNGNPRTITNAVRPGLLSTIPVDTEGNILPPFASIVGNYMNYSFKNDWAVGDGGPTEWSYRRSSTWPFDLCRIISLMHPAKFYNLYADVDNYRWSDEFGQYLVNNRSSLILRDLEIYGDGTPKTSYLNWIVDYQRQWGVDATDKLRTRFKNLDVRMIYRAAAFTDKDLLKFYVEKTSSASTRSSLLIPDESFNILLHDNTPFDRINYSGVVIQLTERGFKVYGNSQTRQVFKTLTPIINGDYHTIEILNLKVQLPNDYSSNNYTWVPYGTEFLDHHTLCQFLANYGAYLRSVGCVFDKIEEGIEVTWDQMIAETLYWAQSGWNIGSTLNINPAAEGLQINRPYSVVQPLTIRNQNYILNQNLYNIQNSDLAVVRNDNYFSVTPLNAGDTVAYGQFHLSNIEHGIVFDNTTTFGDILYTLPTGLRQNRILMRGHRTANWVGVLDANGFILNIDNVQEWNNYTVYAKGVIVTYRSRYYIATATVQPSATFDENVWQICNYDRIQKGLLPNPATRSAESALYYDLYTANLENDADLLAFSLIGYRPRDWMSNSDITDISQVNIYKNMIKQKGTDIAAGYFKNAQLLQGPIDYNIYEIWNIKTYDFGGVLNSNYIELRLDQAQLTGNPTLVGLYDQYPLDTQQKIHTWDYHDYARAPLTDNVLPTLPLNTPHVLDDAGYVHFDDVKAYAYTYYDLPNANKDIYNIYVNEYVWLASYLSQWHVYSPLSLGYSDTIGCNDGCLLTDVLNNKNGTATFRFSGPHGLQQFNMFSVIGFNNFIDGYYIVYGVVDQYTVYVQVDLQNSINTLSGSGIALRYMDHRVATPGAIKNLMLTPTEFVRNRVWVDTDKTGTWGVYLKRLNYKYEIELNSDLKVWAGYWDILDWDEPLWDELAENRWGMSAVYCKRIGVVVGDPLNGVLYYYKYDRLMDVWNKIVITRKVQGYTTGLTRNDDLLFVANPLNSTIDVYYLAEDKNASVPELVQTIQTTNNGIMAVSGDSQYLYLSDKTNNLVNVWSGTTKFSARVELTPAVAFTASINGIVMTVTAITPGTVLRDNMMLIQDQIIVGTYIVRQISGTPGGIGDYEISIVQFLPSISITARSAMMTITCAHGNTLLTTNHVLAGVGIRTGSRVLQTGSNVPLNISKIEANGVEITVTTDTYASGYQAGQIVTISGVTPTDYNGTWRVARGNNTSFTITSTVNKGPATSGIVTLTGNGTIGVYTINSPYATRLTEVLAVNYTYDTVITALNTSQPTAGTIDGTIVGTTLTVTAVSTPYFNLAVDAVFSGPGPINGTRIVQQLTGTPGGVGTYLLSAPHVYGATTFTVSNVGDTYSASIATDYYSDTVVVGAPGVNSGTINNWGAAYYYNRNSQKWEWSGTGAQQFTTTWTTSPRVAVSVNNDLLAAADWTIVGNTLTVLVPLNAGDIVSINDSVYSPVQVTYSPLASQRSVYYGHSVDINTHGSEVVVGAPYEINGDNSEGAVYRYTDSAAKYGSVSGVCLSRLGISTLLINGYAVTIPPASPNDAASTVVTAIRAAKINNVTATSVGNVLTISLINNDDNNPVCRLSVVAPDPQTSQITLASFGLSPYAPTQTILNPHRSRTAQFGWAVRFNEFGNLAISAPTDTRVVFTTFDFEDDENYTTDTIFDNNATQWRDSKANVGAVYTFDYLANYRETLDNVGAFVYAQSVTNLNTIITGGPRFGQSIDYSGGIIIAAAPYFVGAPYSDPKERVVTGQVVVYRNASAYISNWSLHRAPGAIVDITRTNNIHLYDNTTNTTLTTLDYFDPLQGALLGAVRSNLDFITPMDPAQYNSPLYEINSTAAQQNGLTLSSQNQVLWGQDKVGLMWFDTSKIKWVNYHQQDPVYNSQHWGRVFPGSDVAVYTWVNSTSVPAQYSGPGTPFDIQRYVVEYTTNASGNLIPTYYYWVRNTNVINTRRGKTLSDTVVQAYIAAPRSSGIPYFAPLLPQAYALFNCGDYIHDTSTILHIGYASGTGGDVAHVDWKLIRSDYKDDYIPGLPATPDGEPSELYLKWLNSMCGVDDIGNLVPDIYIPQKVRNGVLNSPRQSMTQDRFAALKNYLQYVNSVLIQFPVRETKNPTFLFETGQFYDTTQYWEYVDWWAPGYSAANIPSVQVQNYNDLELLNVPANTIAKVLTNGIGLAEYWAYIVNSPGVWTRVGVERGTIQFLAPLWDYTINQVGWDGNSFDTTDWDEYPSVETAYTLRAINEQLFVDDLLLYRNKALIVFFEYVCTELNINQVYLPWLNKTSFIDVDHYVRTLTTFNTYRGDKQDFLAEYIREVKPYHVTVRDFIYKYTAIDIMGMRYTDFDWPATWQEDRNKYVSPQIGYPTPLKDNQYSLVDPIWNNDRYIDFRENWGLKTAPRPDYEISLLSRPLNVGDGTVWVQNGHSFPYSGVIKVQGPPQYLDGWDAHSWDETAWNQGIWVPAPPEQIFYTGVNRLTGQLFNIIRGYNNTTISNHPIDSVVTMDLPPIMVMEPGRNYAVPPQIRVIYDTTLYAPPREPIVAEPIMSNGRVVGINVINRGSGYGVQPRLEIDPAWSVYPNTIDPTTNTVTFVDPTLVTGDKIRYRVGANSLPIDGLNDGGYYYVGVVSTTPGAHTIALYRTLDDAQLDQHRVDITSTGAGIEQWFELGAIIEPVMNNLPIRQLGINFGWDRVTYRATPQWEPGRYYAPAWSPTTSATPRPVLKYLTIAGTTTAQLTLDGAFTPANLVEAQINRMRVQYITASTYLAAPNTLRTAWVKVIGNNLVELYRDSGFQDSIEANSMGLGSITTTATVAGPAATFTATITGDTIIASCIGTTLTVTTSATSGITVGAEISGPGVTPGTIVTAFISGTGGTGTYTVRPAQTFASAAMTVGGTTLTVYGVSAGTLAVGDNIVGPGVLPNTTIAAFGTGAGGTGTYIVDQPQLVIPQTVMNTATTTLTLANTTGFRVGDPVWFGTSATVTELIPTNTYYIASINGNDITLAGTPHYWQNSGTVAITTGYQYLFSDLPLDYPADRVLLNSTLYECVVDNNDTEFDLNSWRVVPQTFADRVDSYYTPSVNMIGRDLTQIATGVVYPNSTYRGGPFDWDQASQYPLTDRPHTITQSQMDTYLIDRGWPTSAVYDIVEGSSFNSGYAPEELMAGQFKELLNMYVRTDAANWLMTVDAAGYFNVFNINASRNVTTTQSTTRVNDKTDIIYLSNVIPMTYDVTYPVNQVNGSVDVLNVKTILSVAAPVTSWIAKNATTVVVAAPYPLTVTITHGRVVLINGEYIGFESYNPITNTITGLTRGVNNSTINEVIPAGSTVTAINVDNQLPIEWLNLWWYGAFGTDPALANNTMAAETVNPAALFLKKP